MCWSSWCWPRPCSICPFSDFRTIAVAALADCYLLIKATHVGLALLSGAVFAGRGLGVLAGSTAPLARPMRIASMAIDTALLIAALMLLATLGLNPFATPWLLAKLALLVAYVVLGSFAIKRARSTTGKALAYAGALGCFAMMVSVARAHHPLGFLYGLG
ncbi:MAG: invasion activity up-regulator [Comamonadaceae bacterium]|nr:MAG: invasion activity up-regulator [Comamonadaceae bacterium]